jgi:hypothetical protein
MENYLAKDARNAKALFRGKYAAFYMKHINENN